MVAPTERDTILKEVHIDAQPETVYSFFTDPAKMTRWKGQSVVLEPQPGGRYEVDMNSQAHVRGSYVTLEPFSRLVFTWGWEGGEGQMAPGATTVEVTLEPDGAGTLLRMHHTGLSGDEVGRHTEGWDHYLGRLVIAAPGGDPGPDPIASLA